VEHETAGVALQVRPIAGLAQVQESRGCCGKREAEEDWSRLCPDRSAAAPSTPSHTISRGRVRPLGRKDNHLRNGVARWIGDPGLSEGGHGCLESDAQQTRGLGIKPVLVQVGPDRHGSGVGRKSPT
jgi:hypothetical protein